MIDLRAHLVRLGDGLADLRFQHFAILPQGAGEGGAHQMFEQARGYLKQASETCALPWSEGRPKLEALTQEIKSHGNMLSRNLFPELAPSHERELRLFTEATTLVQPWSWAKA